MVRGGSIQLPDGVGLVIARGGAGGKLSASSKSPKRRRPKAADAVTSRAAIYSAPGRRSGGKSRVKATRASTPAQRKKKLKSKLTAGVRDPQMGGHRGVRVYHCSLLSGK